MSLFEDNRYCWRETYLIMLSPKDRPKTDKLVSTIKKYCSHLDIHGPKENGPEEKTSDFLESLTIFSPDDNSGMDIIYQEGEHVQTEFAALADELERHATTAHEKKAIEQGRICGAKIEILHFEFLEENHGQPLKGIAKIRFPRYSSFIKNLCEEDVASPDEFEQAERLDPNTLILILKIVRRLCHGVAFDPASGTVV